MAKVREFLPTVRQLGVKKFVTVLSGEIVKDQLTTQAAAVAYAWLFALFPFLLFLLTLFAYIPEKQKINAHDYISGTVHQVLAKDAAETIISNLDQILTQPRSGLLSIGLIVTLWVASGGMANTMSSLDAAFDVEKPYPFYIQRPVAMLLTIIIVVLIVIVMLLLPVGTAIEHFLSATHRVPARILWLLAFARYILATLLMLAILSLLYNFGTRARHGFVFFSPGAIFTLLVWAVLGESFRFYVDKFGSYQKTYGAIGGVTILLLFFYLDALVLLVGAQINNLIEKTTARSTGNSNNEISNNETLTSSTK